MRIEQNLQACGPVFDDYEDDGRVIRLLKDGHVRGCAHREQFYKVAREHSLIH